MSTIRAGDREFHTLPTGHVLTATAAAASAGLVRQYPDSGFDAVSSTAIGAASGVTIGPFTGTVRLSVECSVGTVEWTAGTPAVVGDWSGTQTAAGQALVSTPGNVTNLLSLATNPPVTYERTVRFKRSALSGAVTNFVAAIDLNVAGVQSRMLPEGGNISIRDASGAALPFHLNRRDSVGYGGAAWSWFTNPRAMYWAAANGDAYTIFSSFRGKDQGSTTTAASVITRINHQTNALDEFVLNAAMFLDDHNHAGLWIRPDGRVVACYADHNNDSILRWRVSTNAIDGDWSQWGAEQTFTASAVVTYANPVYLSDSNRLYFFFRLNTAAWAYVVSTDQGLTFSGEVSFVRRIGSQVYQHMRATGGNRIDFITTDGHPDVDQSISVYHFTMARENGADVFSRSDGSAAAGSLPFAPQSAFTTIYAFTAPTGNAWMWDIARDNNDAPVVLYQRKTIANSLAEYWRGIYTAGSWVNEKIADAGMDISTSGAPDEPMYLGGMSFADYDLTRRTVWLVESPGLTSHAASGMWNLSRYKRVAASTWTMQKTVTANDVVSETGRVCLARPVVPRGQPANKKCEVLYFSGSYAKWDDYNCEIMCWPPLITAAFVRVPALSTVIDTTITLRFTPSAVGVSPESRTLTWQDSWFRITGESLPGQSLLPDDSGQGQNATTLLADVDRVNRNAMLGTGLFVDAATSATAVRLPTSPALNLASLTGWTFLSEVNPVADGTNTRSLFSSWDAGVANANVLIRLNTDNTLSGLAVSAGAATMGGSLGATTFTNGTWASLAVSYNSVAGFLGYRNGAVLGVANTTLIGAMNAGASLRFSLGASPHNAALLWKGRYQGLTLMRGTLSAAWVKAWADNRQAYSTLIDLGDESVAL